jgi:hypothetical protein
MSLTWFRGRIRAARPDSRFAMIRGCCYDHSVLHAPLAQLAEQQTLNLRVRGSSPWRRTHSDLGFYRSRSFFVCPVCPLVGSMLARVSWPGAAGLATGFPWWLRSVRHAGSSSPIGTAPAKQDAVSRGFVPARMTAAAVPRQLVLPGRSACAVESAGEPPARRRTLGAPVQPPSPRQEYQRVTGRTPEIHQGRPHAGRRPGTRTNAYPAVITQPGRYDGVRAENQRHLG